MKQFFFMSCIELALILFSVLLLTQPQSIFKLQTARAKYAATYGGMVLLCVTFCWSVIFGCFLALHELTVRI